MTDVYSDTYWTDEFDITEADLERIAQRMRENRSAYSLDELAKRVVRGRLRHGPEQSPAALQVSAEDPSVRLWDPAGNWAVGDHVVVAVGFTKDEVRFHEPFVGEIVAIEAGKVTVRVDALEKSVDYYTRAKYSDEDLQLWRRFVEALVEARRGTRDVESQVEYVLLEHSQRVASRLLDALQADGRFLTLEGRWFLRELMRSLSADQVESLLQQMLAQSEPMSTPDLVSLVNPPVPEGDVGLFSLYPALNASESFENVGTDTRPLWRAVPPPPPPPERAMGAYFAYDPETYEILLQPGQRLTPRLAQRLQELDLYDVVVTAADEP